MIYIKGRKLKLNNIKIFRNYYMIPIHMYCLYNIFFFYFRAVFLHFYPEQSYTYFRITNKPLENYQYIILYYTILSIIFIVGYVISLHFFKVKKNSFKESLEKKEILKLFYIIFFIEIIFNLYRRFVLGEVVGGAKIVAKYIFFIDWILPLKILYIFILFHEKSKTKKILISIIYGLSIIVNGQKSGLVLPFLIFFFYIVIKNQGLYLKKIVIFVFIVMLIVLLFPFVFEIVGDIRQSSNVSQSLIHNAIKITANNYSNFIIKILRYLYYRLQTYDFFEAIILNHEKLDSEKINILTFFSHLYNELVPSFLEIKDFYIKNNANKLFTILIFNRGIKKVSSDCLTIPGSVVFYTGFLSFLYIFFLGFFFSTIYVFIAKIKNNSIKNVLHVYYNLTFFKIIQSGSLFAFVLSVKEIISFSLLFIITNSIIKIYKNQWRNK